MFVQAGVFSARCRKPRPATAPLVAPTDGPAREREADPSSVRVVHAAVHRDHPDPRRLIDASGGRPIDILPRHPDEGMLNRQRRERLLCSAKIPSSSLWTLRASAATIGKDNYR
jgi:hypothetical protein